MTSLREDNWKLVPGVSRTLPSVPFSIADFNLCPFTAINCNHEYLKRKQENKVNERKRKTEKEKETKKSGTKQ